MEEDSPIAKEIVLRQTVSGNQTPTGSTFMPQYLNLHGAVEDKRNEASSSPALSTTINEPTKCFVDVCLVSSDREIFLCNKLYLARWVKCFILVTF